MKNRPLLNSDLSRLVALSGHTDELTLADAGLPIPAHCERVDLALTHGVPSLVQTLEVLTSELQVEGVILADEIQQHSPELLAALTAFFDNLGEQQGQAITISWMSHEEFKLRTGKSRAVVRTGECRPYANLILQAGVKFP